MSAAPDEKPKLVIKKYSNRRFYDATRKTHVTLPELHDLVVAGHEVEITDSKTGEDITRQVLTQIILERDSEKLDIFSAGVLHQMIRTQQQFLGDVMEKFFGEVLQAHRTSQERWAAFLKNTLGFVPPLSGIPNVSANPMEWTKTWMDAWTGKAAAAGAPSGSRAEAGGAADNEQLRELQRQLAELTKRIEELRNK